MITRKIHRTSHARTSGLGVRLIHVVGYVVAIFTRYRTTSDARTRERVQPRRFIGRDSRLTRFTGRHVESFVLFPVSVEAVLIASKLKNEECDRVRLIRANVR